MMMMNESKLLLKWVWWGVCLVVLSGGLTACGKKDKPKKTVIQAASETAVAQAAPVATPTPPPVKRPTMNPEPDDSNSGDTYVPVDTPAIDNQSGYKSYIGDEPPPSSSESLSDNAATQQPDVPTVGVNQYVDPQPVATQSPFDRALETGDFSEFEGLTPMQMSLISDRK